MLRTPPKLFPEYHVDKGVCISECGRYRYALWRIWNKQLPYLGFLLLNPSTADAETDDPTITRCMARARQLGYGGIYVCNLFAYRATDPAEIYKAPDAIGPENDQWTPYYMLMCRMVICGWGKHGTWLNRDRAVIASLETMPWRMLYALDTNADGSPKHPLYVAYNVQPKPFTGVTLCH